MTFNKTKVLEDIQKYIQKGQIDKALEEYERIIRIDPKDFKLRQKMGDLYLRKGKNAEAIAQYSLVAESYVKDGFYLKAIALYRQILRTEPNRIEIYEKLSDLYKRQGLIADSVAQLRSLAELYEKQKKLSEAMQTWEKIISVDPDNIIYRGKLIEFYLKQGLATRAAEKLKQGIDYFKSKGRYEDVDNLMSHFPGVLEEDKSLGTKVARSLFASGKFKEAIEKIDQVIKINPKDAEAYCIKGLCFLNIGQNNLAKHVFQTSLKLSPDSIDAKKGLMKVFSKEKSWDELVRLLEDVNTTLFAEKAFDEVRALLDSYYAYVPENRYILNAYIELFRTTGDIPALIDKLRKLAAISVREGKVDEGAKYFKDVLSLDPEDVTAKAFLGQLERKKEEQKPQKPEPRPAVREEKAPQKAPQPVVPPPPVVAIEEIELIEDGQTSIANILDEVSGLIKIGSLVKAKRMLEDLSAKYSDNTAVKEKWADYFEKTKDGEAYLIVVDELINLYRQEENRDRLAYYLDMKARRTRPKAQVLPAAAPAVSPSPRPAVHVEPEPIELEEAVLQEEIEDASVISPNIEEMLLEADFYNKNGLVDEAVELCRKILAIDPGNEKAKGIVEAHAAPIVEPPVAAKSEETGDFFDLSGEILKELEKEEVFRTPFASEAEKISFEELLKDFKAKISKEIEEGDVETHYNLGIAYKEMGLLDDAIQEFVLTSRFSFKSYDSYIMIASCLSEKGEMDKAIEFYRKSLVMPDVTDERKAGIYLEIGNLFERHANEEMAYRYLKKAYSIDGSLKIAQEKLVELEKRNPGLSSIAEQAID